MRYTILALMMMAMAAHAQGFAEQGNVGDSITYGAPVFYDTISMTDPITGNEYIKVISRQSIVGWHGRPVHDINEVRIAMPLKPLQEQVLDKLQQALHVEDLPDCLLLPPDCEIVADENGHIVYADDMPGIQAQGPDGTIRSVGVTGGANFFNDIKAPPATYNGAKTLYRQVLRWNGYIVAVKDHKVMWGRVGQ